MTTSLFTQHPHVRPWQAALFAAALLTAAILPAAGANADEPSQSCWRNVDTGQTRCFDAAQDPLQQIADDTNTTVVAVPSDAPQARLAAPQGSVTKPATTYALVILYEHTSFGGASFTYFTSDPQTCIDTAFPNSPIASGWNDRVESFESFNGCMTTLYQDLNYGGVAYGPFISSTNLGSFNDQASSLLIESVDD